MRPRARGGLGRRIWALLAGAAVAALVLMEPRSEAHAQRFSDAVVHALDNSCDGLAGPKRGSLESLCAASGPAGPTSAAGASIATQTVRQQGADERRIRLRLEEQRQARGEGGELAASSDPSFQMGKLGLFVTAEGDWVRKDRTRFEEGFSSDAGGFIVGADYRVLPSLTAGLAFSYLNTNGDYKGNNGNFRTDAYGVTLYGSVTPLPNLFVDGTLGFTRRDYDVVRRASFTAPGPGVGVNGFVKGDTTGDEFRTSVQAGYDFVRGALTVGPRVGLNYSTNDIGGFNERNVSPRHLDTGLQLSYDGQHRESLTSTVGAFLSYAFSTSVGIFVPQLTAEWVHEFFDNQRVIYFRFREDLGQTKLRFQTDPPDRNYANVGTGVVLVLPKGMQVFLAFRALVGYSDRQAYTANGGFRIAF